jgi:hypothetical protein
VLLVFVLTLTKIGAQTVNDAAYFYAQLYQPKVDFEFTAVYCLFFYLIFTPYEELIHKVSQKRIQVSRKKILAIILLIILPVNFVLFLISTNSMFVAAINRGYQSRLDYDGKGWLYYPDVVEYYNQNVTDRYVTMGFFCAELVTFANRPVIDLADPILGMSFYSILDTATESDILKRIRQLNVRYFLMPKMNNPYYSLCEKLINSSVFGDIFLDNPQFRAIGSFKFATLYKFYEDSACAFNPIPQSRVEPWNFDPTKNYTLTIESTLTKFAGTTNGVGELSLMYTFDSPLTVDDALCITIKTYKQVQLFVILYSNFQNRTTDSLTLGFRLINGKAKPILYINDGVTTGNFDPNHVEGVLIGIRTQAYQAESFEIYEVYSILYENK